MRADYTILNFMQIDADVLIINEMFPNVSQELIKKMLHDGLSTEAVIDSLLADNCKMLIKKHAGKVMDNTEESLVCVSRSCIYHKAKIFYKSAIHHPNELCKFVTVIFPGEEGADLGALRNEYLIEVLRGLRDEFFEGNSERLLPKNIWGHECELKMAGAAVAHSVLQGGPAFSCLHPAVYARIVGYESDDVGELPSVEDIPKHAGTLDLLEFIDKVWIYFISVIIS